MTLNFDFQSFAKPRNYIENQILLEKVDIVLNTSSQLFLHINEISITATIHFPERFSHDQILVFSIVNFADILRRNSTNRFDAENVDIIQKYSVDIQQNIPLFWQNLDFDVNHFRNLFLNDRLRLCWSSSEDVVLCIVTIIPKYTDWPNSMKGKEKFVSIKQKATSVFSER